MVILITGASICICLHSLFLHLAICLRACPCIYFSICLLVCLLPCLCVRLFMCLSVICFSFYLRSKGLPAYLPPMQNRKLLLNMSLPTFNQFSDRSLRQVPFSGRPLQSLGFSDDNGETNREKAAPRRKKAKKECLMGLLYEKYIRHISMITWKKRQSDATFFVKGGL